MNIKIISELIFLFAVIIFKFMPSLIWKIGVLSFITIFSIVLLYLYKKEVLLISTIERVLIFFSIWFLPWHIVSFVTCEIFLINFISEKSLKKFLIVFIILVIVSWIFHVLSTFSPSFKTSLYENLKNNITFFRFKWLFTIPFFAITGTLFLLLSDLSILTSNGSLNLIILCQPLLYWFARITDYKPHFFSHYALSAIFITGVLTFIFYLTDMLKKTDIFKIWIFQYVIFLLTGQRGYLSFLIFLCMFYIIRRLSFELKLSLKEYQNYKITPQIFPPLILATLLLFSQRNFSYNMLFLFVISWLPLLLEESEKLKEIPLLKNIFMYFIPKKDKIFISLISKLSVFLIISFIFSVLLVIFAKFSISSLLIFVTAGTIYFFISIIKKENFNFNPYLFWSSSFMMIMIIIINIFLFWRLK